MRLHAEGQTLRPCAQLGLLSAGARKRAITKGTLGTLGTTPQQRSQCRGVHSENVIEMEKYIATPKGAATVHS